MKISRKFDRLIEISKALKLTNQTGRTFHVCFALRGPNIICIGINNYNKTNKICASYKRTKFNYGSPYTAGVHAEQAILGRLKYREDLKDITLVNIRIDNNNNLNYAAPCANCSYHLGLSSIRKIWYSTKDGFEKLK